MDSAENDGRQFSFKDNLKFFRTFSGGDRNDSAYSSVSDLAQASPPELQMAQSDGTSNHWNTMHLYQFIHCGKDYVNLFQSQLPYFKACGAWNTHKVSCITVKEHPPQPIYQ